MSDKQGKCTCKIDAGWPCPTHGGSVLTQEQVDAMPKSKGVIGKTRQRVWVRSTPDDDPHMEVRQVEDQPAESMKSDCDCSLCSGRGL